MLSDTANQTIPSPIGRRFGSFQAALQDEVLRTCCLCLLLATVTLLAYWSITGHSFLKYDDDEYITTNRQVATGLTWAGVGWAFSTGHACNWHPLTWLSHMLDCQLYGINPAGHHITSLLFHIANTLLLFGLLSRMTRAMWRSAFVAALFALHPLHVESVAWASERKDVLSTFFFLLTLLAYTKYVVLRDQSTSGLQVSEIKALKGYRTFYLLSLLLFALGLMSKPMVVTLPFVLLLLDYWPLQRFQLSAFHSQISTFSRLLLEKVPFLILALTGSIVTFLVQQAGGATYSIERIPIYTRLANAFIAYVRYLSKTVWPTDLAVFYPYQEHWPLALVVAAVLWLAVLSALCVGLGKDRRYLFVGWFWFLGTLVPTIGLVQVGSQSMADRYMYIPSIGLFVLIAWGLDALSLSVPKRRQLLSGGAAAILGLLVICTANQLRFWQNDETVFRHAFEVTDDNYVAYVHLADAADVAGDRAEALKLCLNAVRIRPCFAEGHYNAGTYLIEMGQLNEATLHLEQAIKINPRFARAHANLGKAFLALGRLNDGINQLSENVKLEPGSPQAHYGLGTALLKSSRPADAIAELSEALRLNPSYAEAHMNFAIASINLGRTNDALTHFAEAVRLAPENPEARFNFGLALLDRDQPTEAASQFASGLRLRPDDVRMQSHLAQALARK